MSNGSNNSRKNQSDAEFIADFGNFLQMSGISNRKENGESHHFDPAADDFARFLRANRLAHGLTKFDLAHQSGLSDALIVCLEKGIIHSSQISNEWLDALAKPLQEDPSTLRIILEREEFQTESTRDRTSLQTVWRSFATFIGANKLLITFIASIVILFTYLAVEELSPIVILQALQPVELPILYLALSLVLIWMGLVTNGSLLSQFAGFRKVYRTRREMAVIGSTILASIFFLAFAVVLSASPMSNSAKASREVGTLTPTSTSPPTRAAFGQAETSIDTKQNMVVSARTTSKRLGQIGSSLAQPQNTPPAGLGLNQAIVNTLLSSKQPYMLIRFQEKPEAIEQGTSFPAFPTPTELHPTYTPRGEFELTQDLTGWTIAATSSEVSPWSNTSFDGLDTGETQLSLPGFTTEATSTEFLPLVAAYYKDQATTQIMLRPIYVRITIRSQKYPPETISYDGDRSSIWLMEGQITVTDYQDPDDILFPSAAILQKNNVIAESLPNLAGMSLPAMGVLTFLVGMVGGTFVDKFKARSQKEKADAKLLAEYRRRIICRVSAHGRGGT